MSEQDESLAAQLTDLRIRVWNALIPQSAVRTVLHPEGVSYLHPTKGWKWIGKKRFAVRGVH